MSKCFTVLLIAFLFAPAIVHGWDFFGLFKKSEPTTTPTPISSTTEYTTTTTASPDNEACWWTTCGTRCAATASVHDFNTANCNPGQYKFRCCSS